MVTLLGPVPICLDEKTAALKTAGGGERGDQYTSSWLCAAGKAGESHSPALALALELLLSNGSITRAAHLLSMLQMPH